jgi:membrane-associated phospholipid phosphatase
MADLDSKILRFMRTRGHTPALERGARLLGKAGNNGAGWFVAGAALAAADKPRRAAWGVAAVLGPGAIGLNYGVKLLVKRPRPVLKGLPPLGGAPSSLSFPSAHSTSSFAVATAMTRIDRRAAVAFIPAVAVAAGRPYLGMHYPSDVAVGVVLGTALGLAVPLPRPAEAPLPPKAPAAAAPSTNGSTPTAPASPAPPSASLPPDEAPR